MNYELISQYLVTFLFWYFKYTVYVWVLFLLCIHLLVLVLHLINSCFKKKRVDKSVGSKIKEDTSPQ